MIFSYQKNSEKVVHTVNFKGTITYTFEDIAKLFHEHINTKEKVVNMYYNKKIVVLTIIKGYTLKLCKELADILRFPFFEEYEGDYVGDPIHKSDIKITFSDTRMIFFKCDQIVPTYLNNVETQFLSVIPLSTGIDGGITADFTHPPSAFFKYNYTKIFNFSVCDKNGNKLPVNQIIVRLLINDCIHRQNISSVRSISSNG